MQDALTEVVNRAGAELIVTPMIERARRSGEAVHSLFINVDGMRVVNAAGGLAAGDAVLRAVAKTLGECVRGTDVVVRWNGDEFVVLGPGNGISPLELERRVRAALLATPVVPTDVWTGRVSIGSATLVPWDEGGLADLVERAEKDMVLRRSLRRRTPANDGSPWLATPPPPEAGAGNFYAEPLDDEVVDGEVIEDERA